jgi:hypothetical protein
MMKQTPPLNGSQSDNRSSFRHIFFSSAPKVGKEQVGLLANFVLFGNAVYLAQTGQVNRPPAAPPIARRR